MLAALKSVLYAILPITLYVGMFATAIAGAVKRAEWALYLLIILIPLPVLWYQLHAFPLGKSTMDILVFATFLGILINKGGFERAPGTAVIATYVLVSYLAVWNATLRFNLSIPLTTANPLLADWKNYAEMIFLYFLAYNAIRTEDQQKVTVVIITAVILFIVVHEFRNFSESTSFSYEKRAEGPFGAVGLGANHFAAFIAHYVAVVLGLYLVDTHKRRKWLYLATTVFAVHPLFFAYSRGAYLAALMVILVYGLVKKRALLALVAVLVFTWQVVLPTTVVERITMTENSSGEIENSAAMRLVVWQHAEQLFEDNRIFGIGFNSFGFTVPPGSLTDTHNFYMKTACEQGVIGLLVLAALLLRALMQGWRLYRGGQSLFHQGLGLGFVGCIFAVAVSNIFGDRWSYFALGGYFWIFWGLVDRSLAIAHAAPAADEAAVTPAAEVPADVHT